MQHVDETITTFDPDNVATDGPGVNIQGDPIPQADDLLTVLSLYHKAAAGIDGIFVLTAITPDRKSVKTEHFKVGDVDGMAAAARRLAKRNNVYCAPVLYRSNLSKKSRGKAADIVAVLALGFDDDADTGKRVTIPDGLVPTIEIASSPGNRNLIFMFEQPLSVEDAKAASEELYRQIGGDSGGHDIDHVWRLPDTLNYPNEAKLKRGRAKEPLPVTLLKVSGVYQQWASTHKTEKPAELGQSDDDGRDIPAAEKLREVLLDALPGKLRDKVLAAVGSQSDRSTHSFNVMRALMEYGWTDKMVRAVAHDSPFAEKWEGNRDDLRREIAAVRKKWRADGEQLAVGSSASVLARLLATHWIVMIEGHAYISTWKANPSLGIETLEHLTFSAFQHFYSDKRVTSLSKDRVTQKPITETFKDRAKRFSGLVYMPGSGAHVEGSLNLWRGFGIEPKAGDWSLMRQHIHDVLADGSGELADYIIKWAAWAVQNPGEQAEAVLVFMGEEGSGKGVFGRNFIKMFGNHGTHIRSRKHLVGNFNQHLQHTSALFADEAFWPGDKEGEGVLKGLVTEDTLTIEPKGINAFEVRNTLHIVMSSNKDWAIPAGINARRFAVFKVNNKYAFGRMGDEAEREAYFAPLYRQMTRGGLAAMLHDLLAMDLKGWHPRNIPNTKALLAQKIASADWIDKVMLDIAHRGELPGSTPDNPSWSYTQGSKVFDLGLWGHFRLGAPRSERLSMTDTMLAKELRDRYGFVTGDKARFRMKRGAKAPPLPKLRELIDARFGGKMEWDDQVEWSTGSGDEWSSDSGENP